MAKKSNKTEHVLKLITKNDEDSQDDYFGIEKEIGDKDTVAPHNEKVQKSKESPVDIIVDKEPAEEKELKNEAKLKIEIQPEEKPHEPQEQKKPDEPEALGKVLLYENHLHDKEGSAYIEQHDHLVNIAETLAKEKITIVMEKMKVCNCPTCVNDVLALTLNSLPTKYVTTDAGKQYFQLDIYKKQYETDVLAALTKACVRVKASPRHEK